MSSVPDPATTEWVPIWGPALEVYEQAAEPIPAGSGAIWIDTDETAPQVLVPWYGTSPPGSPTDGQIWFFPADATNGVIWQFRYNAGSASTAKWEFVGGAPRTNMTDARDTTTSTAYVVIANSPGITVAHNGNYEASYGMNAWTTGATATAWAALRSSDQAPGAILPLSEAWYAGNMGAVIVRTTVINMNAGQTVSLCHRADSGYTNSYERRWLSLRPIKVVAP